MGEDAMPAVRSVTPYLVMAGAAAAIEWYRDVLGADEVSRQVGGAGQHHTTGHRARQE